MLASLRPWLAVLWLCPRGALPSSAGFRAGRLACLALYGYLGMALVLMALEDELVYRPKRYPTIWSEPPASARVVDVWLRTADGTLLHGWWLAPEGWEAAQGALLHCHGIGCNVSQLLKPALHWQASFQRAVLLFDYPGFGKSGGTVSEAGCYAASVAAFDWLREVQGIDSIVIHGHSLGGAVAIDLAGNRRPHALLVTSSFTTGPEVGRTLVPIYPTAWLMRNRLDSLSKLARLDVPLFMAHGTADGRVPFTQGQRLFAISPSRHKRFHVVEQGSHNLLWPPSFTEPAVSFLVGVSTAPD